MYNYNGGNSGFPQMLGVAAPAGSNGGYNYSQPQGQGMSGGGNYQSPTNYGGLGGLGGYAMGMPYGQNPYGWYQGYNQGFGSGWGGYSYPTGWGGYGGSQWATPAQWLGQNGYGAQPSAPSAPSTADPAAMRTAIPQMMQGQNTANATPRTQEQLNAAGQATSANPYDTINQALEGYTGTGPRPQAYHNAMAQFMVPSGDEDGGMVGNDAIRSQPWYYDNTDPRSPFYNPYASNTPGFYANGGSPNTPYLGDPSQSGPAVQSGPQAGQTVAQYNPQATQQSAQPALNQAQLYGTTGTTGQATTGQAAVNPFLDPTQNPVVAQAQATQSAWNTPTNPGTAPTNEQIHSAVTGGGLRGLLTLGGIPNSWSWALTGGTSGERV